MVTSQPYQGVPPTQPPEAAVTRAEVPPEQRRFVEVLNELIIAINDVVYTSNLLDGQLVQQHPEIQDLVDAVRRLGRVAWEFQKLVRRAAGTSKQ